MRITGAFRRPITERGPEAVNSNDLLHSAKQHRHGHAGQLGALRAGEQVFATQLLRFLQYCHRARREWNAVFLARLHAFGWHRPNRLGQIDLAPFGGDNLAGPRGGENDKLQRQRGNRLAPLQLLHECGDRIIGHRLVMAA